MKDIKSTLIFDNYIVNNIEYIKNENFQKTKKPVEIDFSIKKQANMEDNRMNVKLLLEVFGNSEQNNYPFEMRVAITGHFIIANKEEKVNFEPNAIAILYPYVRAIVSTYTASANISPLILPAINVNKLIEDQENT